jgi:hypothetical protein
MPLRELGVHPESGETINVYNGRYGPYVKHIKTNASLPKDKEVESGGKSYLERREFSQKLIRRLPCFGWIVTPILKSRETRVLLQVFI